MKLLQIITDFYNTEPCPATIDCCELVFDSENTRMLLRLTLGNSSGKLERALIDIGCYDKNGILLSFLEGIEYNGKAEISLPSLMTYSAVLILREARLADGSVWTSDAGFPAEISVTASADDTFDDTVNFDPISITDKEISSPTPSAKSKRELRREKFEREEELRRIIKNDPEEKKRRMITRLVSALVIIAILGTSAFVLNYKSRADAAYKKASNLYNSGKFEEAIPALREAADFIFSSDDKDELYWRLAMSYARSYDFYNAAVHFSNLGDYKESKANYQSISKAYKGIVSAGDEHTLALHGDGTVSAVGSNKYGQCDVAEWSGIVQVSAGGRHSVAVAENGTAAATGDNTSRQCDVDNWRSITDISAGESHTVGVKSNGSAVAVGSNKYGQCDVDGWSGIVSVSAGNNHTVGLRIDGTATAAGSNEYGQCDVGNWSNLVSVAAGHSFSAGLTYDGKILIAGSLSTDTSSLSDVKNCLFISAGDYNILSVSKNGSVVSVGSNDNNQGATSVWTGIVAADAGSRHSVGISADGKALGAGEGTQGQIDLEGWQNISIPKNTVTIRKGL